MQISSLDLCSGASFMWWQHCTPCCKSCSPKICPCIVIHSVMETYWGNITQVRFVGAGALERRKGKEELEWRRGCERGLCLETDWYKNADKPAPRILLAWKPFLFAFVHRSRSESEGKGLWRDLLGCLWKRDISLLFRQYWYLFQFN